MNIKPIPLTMGYMASDNGTIYNSDMVILEQYESKDGYMRAGIQRDDGRFVTMGVHRLVLLSHLGPATGKQTEANHRDMDRKNNRIDNLEWVTRTENEIHASLFNRNQGRPLILAMDADGQYSLHANAYIAAEAIGCTPLEIWDAIKNDQPVNRWMFWYLRFDTPLPVALRKETIPTREADGRPKARAISIRDLDTGEVENFPTMALAARRHDTSVSHIHQAIGRDGKHRLFRKRYQIVYAGEPFVDIPDDILEDLRGLGAKPTVGYNTRTKTLVFYSNAHKFISDNRLSKKAVTTALKAGEIKLVDGWYFVYHTTENMKKLQEQLGFQTKLLSW